MSMSFEYLEMGSETQEKRRGPERRKRERKREREKKAREMRGEGAIWQVEEHTEREREEFACGIL